MQSQTKKDGSVLGENEGFDSGETLQTVRERIVVRFRDEVDGFGVVEWRDE